MGKKRKLPATAMKPLTDERAAPLPLGSKRKLSAMKPFLNERRVRLRSCGREGLYLHADEDGVGVHLRQALPECPHAEWEVHRVEDKGHTVLLLLGAAYGRYLAATDDPAPRGHLGRRVVQGVYDDSDDKVAISWKPYWVSKDDRVVSLEHISGNRYLRANGKYCMWRKGVSVAAEDRSPEKPDPMMHWVLETIPETPLTPQLPPPSLAAPPGGFWNRLFGRTAPVVERRTILFVLAPQLGGHIPKDRTAIEFYGRSLSKLRLEMAHRLFHGIDNGFKLYVQAGRSGRPIPLVTDLPRNEDPIEIIIFPTPPTGWKRKRQWMERFPDDGRRVRLRSRGRDGMYLQASEDGVGVHLSPSLAESLLAEWQVHRVERDGETFLLLYSSAYGRYLATAPRGYHGHRIVQEVYDDEYLDAVAWSPGTVAQEDDDVQLWHGSSKLCLTANGKYFRWRTSVSLGKYGAHNVMMHWVVEAIPAMPFMPQLPPPSPAATPGGFWNRILGRNTPVVERRMIRFVRAEHDGSYDPNDWRMIEFHGRSVYNLRSAVAENLNEGTVTDIKLYVRAGTLGGLTPLIIDLPRNDEPMDIVVFSTLAPGSESLSAASYDNSPSPNFSATSDGAPRTGPLNPAEVFNHFSNGDKNGLLKYLDTIEGALQDPHCHMIKKLAKRLATGKVAVEGDPENVKKWRENLALDAQSKAEQSRLSRFVKVRHPESSTSTTAHHPDIEDKVVVARSALGSLHAEWNNVEAKVQEAQQQLRIAEMDPEERAQVIKQVKERTEKLNKFKSRLEPVDEEG